MANKNEADTVFVSRQIELTKKYFGKYMDEIVAQIIHIFKECNIPNINREDCEDMYNEFFTYAVKTYNPSVARFKLYLKRIVEHQTISIIRRVISKRDPLFYSVSLDRSLSNGTLISEALGENDLTSFDYDMVMASPNARKFDMTPVDQLILYYRGCGYTLREISEKLHLSVATVQRRIIKQRSNKKLLKSLNALD